MGHSSQSEHKINNKTQLEPLVMYLGRIMFVAVCICMLIVILLVLIAMAGLLCILITEKYTGLDDS